MSAAAAHEPTAAPPPKPVVRLAPSRGWVGLNLKELWSYRELVWFLALRDLKVRYKQTLLGVAWAVLQPVLTMVVFSIVFGKLVGVDSEGLPYPLFAYAALIPWQYFATGLATSSNSLVGNAGLISKVYFPRLAAPIAPLLAGAVDFALAFLVLIGLMVWHGHAPTANVIWLPLFLLLTFITALGVGLWLSALNVRWRDVRYTVPFLTQVWLFASPIAYSSSLIPERWQLLYALNPMVGVVEGFRWALLGTDTAPGPMIGVSALAALVLLFTGAFTFRRMERQFADVV